MAERIAPGASELAEELRQSAAAVAAALGGMTAESLGRRPAPEEWSAWDIAYHLVQIEVWYIAKLCEAAAGNPAAALSRFLNVLDLMRAEAQRLVSELPADRLDVPGQLSGVPDWTPRLLVERMTAHDHEHAAQVRAARGEESGGGDGTVPPSPGE